MRVAPVLYTLASLAVLAFMVTRPPVMVEAPSSAAAQPPDAASASVPPATSAGDAPVTAPQPATPAQDAVAPPQPSVPAQDAVTPPQPAAPASGMFAPTQPMAPSPVAPPPIQPLAPAGGMPGTFAPASPVPPSQPAVPNGGMPGAAPDTQPGQPVTLPEDKPADTQNKPAPDAAVQPDYEREQRLANEIRDSILDGEVVSLHDGNRDFMAIFTPAEQPRGAVILLHGRGHHPDWEDVVHPLRVGLVAKGWSTLSLQMPVLANEAKYYDYVPVFANAARRVDAGIQFLRQKGVDKIVLAAHSCGAHMANHWLATKGDAGLVAFIGLGVGATDYGQELVEPFPYAKLKGPVLDVYGEQEYPQVLKLAPERQALIQQAGNPYSLQLMLPAADHYFKGKGDELTSVVADWLNKLPL